MNQLIKETKEWSRVHIELGGINDIDLYEKILEYSIKDVYFLFLIILKILIIIKV